MARDRVTLVMEGSWRSPRRWISFEGDLAIGGGDGIALGRNRPTPGDTVDAPAATISARDGHAWVTPGTSVVMVGDTIATGAVELHHGDRFSVGGVRMYRLFASDLDTARREQRQLDTCVDPMTGLLDRRLLLRYLQRVTPPGALLLIDIDWLKRLCDQYGHRVGDHVIQLTAERIRSVVEWPTLLGRYGGEEFMVVARGASREQARTLAEQIRLACEPEFAAFPFEDDGTRIRATVSVGIAMLGVDRTATIQTAEETLLDAKRQGRNRISGPSDRA